MSKKNDIKKAKDLNSDKQAQRIEELKRAGRKWMPPPSQKHRNKKKDTRLRRRERVSI
jgi:hypothetical protein